MAAANIPSWETTDLNTLAASNQLSGVSPQVLAAIAQAESGGQGGAINSEGYGGYFGIGASADYPAGQSSTGLLQGTGNAPFEQQAVLAASDFASMLNAEGGNVLKAEMAYQQGPGAVPSTGAPSGEGVSVFQSLGIGGTMAANPSVATTGTGSAAGSTDAASTAAQDAANALNQQAQNQSQQSVIYSMIGDLGLPAATTNALISQAMGILQNPNVSADQALYEIQQSPAFQEAFPGIGIAQKNGYPVPSPSDYLSYVQQAQSLAQAAGLPNFSPSALGQLIGNNVSLSELESRITNGYQAVNNMDPNTVQYFENEMGIGKGQLANFFLDPDNSMGQIAQQTGAAQIGGAGVNAGFAPISKSLAMQLAGEGVTQSAAVSGFKNIAPLLPLTEQMLGQGAGSPGTVTQSQLVNSQFVGDAASTEAIRLAQETRGASTGGGGGYQAERTGTAVGSASEAGGMGAS